MDKMCPLYPLSFKGLSGGSRSAAHSPNETTVFDAPFKISEVAAFALGPWCLQGLIFSHCKGMFWKPRGPKLPSAKMTRCDKTFDFVQQECSAGPFFGRLSSLSCDRVLGWISQWKCVVTMGFQSPTCSRTQDSIEDADHHHQPQPHSPHPVLNLKSSPGPSTHRPQVA